MIPPGLALDPTGHRFVSAAGTNTIVKVAPDGTKTTFVVSGLNDPAGLAFDAEGNLLVADKGSDSILSIGRDGK